MQHLCIRIPLYDFLSWLFRFLAHGTAELGRGISLPAEITACCWDPTSPGTVGLCGPDGSFMMVSHASGIRTGSMHSSTWLRSYTAAIVSIFTQCTGRDMVPVSYKKYHEDTRSVASPRCSPSAPCRNVAIRVNTEESPMPLLALTVLHRYMTYAHAATDTNTASEHPYSMLVDSV